MPKDRSRVKTEDSPTVGEGKARLPEKEMAFLGKMLEYHMEGNDAISYERLRLDFDIGHRVKSQLAAHKALITDGYIEPSVSGGKSDYRITQKGRDLAATDEYKEFLKDSQFVPTTNEEKHDKIKKRLKYKKRGPHIFDLLMQYGSLTAVELAALLCTQRGTHQFSYAVKELRDKKYAEADPAVGKGKLRLADLVFLKPEDRPEPEVIDPGLLAGFLEANAKPRRGGKYKRKVTEGEEDAGAPKSKKAKKEEKPKKKKKNIKAEDDDEDDKEEEEGPLVSEEAPPPCAGEPGTSAAYC